MINSKNIRLIEFLIVIAVTFGSSLFNSIYIVLNGVKTDYSQYAGYSGLFWGSYIIKQLSLITLVIYLLIRQGSNLKELGFSFFGKNLIKDLIISIPLAIISRSAEAFFFIIIQQACLTNGIKLNIAVANTDFLKLGINFWSVTAMIINPFFEEIIARAYIIREVKFLAKNVGLAVAISVAIQSTYHFYQGVFPVLLHVAEFTVFSLYYIKWQRIMPIIFAHMYFDLIPLYIANHSQFQR